jgi:hypothetical protein
VYDVWTMKRTNIYLPDRQLGLLRRVSESRGRPVAELVRDAVDSWLAAEGIRAIPPDEWEARFDALLGRRRKIAKGAGFAEERVLRDVNVAVAEARRGARRTRTARRR